MQDARSGESQRLLVANGYISAKMDRARLLHAVALRLVGMSSGPEGAGRAQQAQQQQPDPAGSDAAAVPAGEQPPAEAQPMQPVDSEATAEEPAAGSGAAAAAATSPAAQPEADFVITAVPGEEGASGSRLDVVTTAADDPRRRWVCGGCGVVSKPSTCVCS